MPLLLVAVAAVIAFLALESKNSSGGVGGSGDKQPNKDDTFGPLTAGEQAAKDAKDALANIARPDTGGPSQAYLDGLTGTNTAGENKAKADNYGLGDQEGTATTTGTTGGDLAKTVAGVVAVAAVAAGGAYAGAYIGQESDKALGGTGGGVTGTVAQAGGAVALGAGAAAGAALGASALGLGAAFATIAVIAAPIAVVALAVTVVVYAIGSAISDLNRLSYGQQGAIRDYDKQWQNVHDRMFAKLRANPANAKMRDSEIDRMLVPIVDGFMRNLNDIAFTQWQKRGGVLIGQNLSPSEHARFGSERGYFVGNGRPGYNTLIEAGLRIRSIDESFVLKCVPAADTRTQTINVPPPSYVAITNAQRKGKVKLDDDAINPKQKATSYVTHSDTKNVFYQAIGRSLCNVSQYGAYMKSPDGKGQDPVKRCKQGLAEGAFTGSCGDGGTLVFAGATFDFRSFDAIV
jgi:hypothetical protein